MGHLRTGGIPKTRKWRDVVSSINTDFHSKRNSHHLAQKFFPKNIGMY